MTEPRVVKLQALVTDAKSGFACGEDDPNGVLQVRMNNIRRDGTLDYAKKRRVPGSMKAINGTLLAPGDVLFNATNSPELVGKTALITDLDEPTVFSNHFIRLRADRSRILPSYLARWLHWQFEMGRFRAMCRQWVNQATVSREALLGLDVPVLPLAEQQRVAHLLAQAEALRAKRQATLTNLDQLAHSIFIDMFGTPKEWEARWHIAPFSSVLTQDLRNGTSPSSDGDNPGTVLTLSAITGSRFDPSAAKPAMFRGQLPDSQYVNAADFLICRGNGNLTLVGRGHYPLASMPDTVFPDTIIAARTSPEVVDRYFLGHVWASPFVRRQIEAAARTTNGTFKVNQKMIKDIAIPLPPIELQRRYGERCAEIARVILRYDEQEKALGGLFESLRARAFRGEL